MQLIDSAMMPSQELSSDAAIYTAHRVATSAHCPVTRTLDLELCGAQEVESKRKLQYTT
jgi:hypothetical protein